MGNKVPESTWYLPDHAPESGICYPMGAVPDSQFSQAARILRDAARGACERMGEDFSLDAFGRRFRGHRTQAVSGPMFVLRTILPRTPALEDPALGYSSPIRKHALHPKLRSGGLMLISGATGTGKSTTAAASLVSRLRLFGGVAVTVEDPPEYDLHGQHNKGYCLQTAVTPQYTHEDLIRKSLRCYPSGAMSTMLLIGEVRDPGTAAQALLAALNGHLVITTAHANSLTGALHRVISLAAQDMGDSNAHLTMATTFQVGVYQSVRNGKLDTQLLSSVSSGPETISGAIKNGDFSSLGTEIQRQQNLTRR